MLAPELGCGHEAAGISWCSGRRGGGVANGGACSAAGNAGGRVPAERFARCDCAHARSFSYRTKEGGFVEGQNVGIVYHYAHGQYDRLPAFAADLIQNHVATIFAGGPPAALAAKAASSTIPIVFTSADPVGDGSRRQFQPAGRQSHRCGFFCAGTRNERVGIVARTRSQRVHDWDPYQSEFSWHGDRMLHRTSDRPSHWRQQSAVA